MRSTTPHLALALLALTACEGSITGSRGPGGTGGPPGGTGGPGTPALAVANDAPARRLSRAELSSTVHALLASALPQSGEAAWTSVQAPLASVPSDVPTGATGEKRGGFRRLDQAVQQQHVEALFALAAAVGQEVAGTTARLQESFGPCATDADTSNDAACVTAFVRRFGERVLRRAVTDDDVAFYAAATSGGLSPTTARDLVTELFTAPDLFYLLEPAAADGGTVTLDAYALAARLAYHAWGAPPDDALLASARSGALLEDAEYQAQVARLYADRRAQANVQQFFDEWFRLEELPPLDALVTDARFKAFAGADLPGPTLRGDMVQDVLDMTWWVVQHGGSFQDLFTDRHSFARTPGLAKIYGVSPWDGTSTPPAFPDASRVGLLTRAAFLSTGTASTRPIMKGVRIRMGLLCDPVPPPPANASSTPIDLTGNQTTREVIEQVTQQDGSVCAGCHKPLINPLGFATENFDSLGRPRTAQTFYDATGAVTGSKPVDTTSLPQVTAGDVRASTGAGDVTQYLVQSGKLESCFAEQMFRFAFRRVEVAGSADATTMKAIADAAHSGRPLASVLQAVALRPEFRQRSTTSP